MKYRCRICDGRLQDLTKPLIFSAHLKVWSCTECALILKDIPPKENDGQEE